MVDAVVTTIVFHVNVVSASKLLKGALRGDGFFAGGSFLVTTMNVFGHAVDKEGGTGIAALAVLTSLKWYEASNGRAHLVGGDEFARESGSMCRVGVVVVRSTNGTTELAVWTDWDSASANGFGVPELAFASPCLDELHIDVTALAMNIEEQPSGACEIGIQA
jgi:hypothetical protein